MPETNSRALVTGGAGFIGSHLVDRLISDGWKVTVLDDLSSGSLENLASHSERDLTFVRGSVTDPQALQRAAKDATHVFHLAAQASVVRSVEDPFGTNEVNLTGTLALLEISRKSPLIRRFVMTSSSAIYGDTRVLPITESAAANPLSPYALQKWASERYVRMFHSLYGFPGVTLRLFNVFGPRQRPDSLYAAAIPIFLAAARENKPLTINGDGGQTRDFVYVTNVVDAFMLAAATSNPEALGNAFNIGNSERTSVLDLASQLIRLAGSQSRCEYGPARAGEVRDSFASIELAREILGYAPRVSFSKGLELLVRTP